MGKLPYIRYDASDKGANNTLRTSITRALTSSAAANDFPDDLNIINTDGHKVGIRTESIEQTGENDFLITTLIKKVDSPVEFVYPSVTHGYSVINESDFLLKQYTIIDTNEGFALSSYNGTLIKPEYLIANACPTLSEISSLNIFTSALSPIGVALALSGHFSLSESDVYRYPKELINEAREAHVDVQDAIKKIGATDNLRMEGRIVNTKSLWYKIKTILQERFIYKSSNVVQPIFNNARDKILIVREEEMAYGETPLQCIMRLKEDNTNKMHK